jgi:hypothetical protein
MMNISFLFTEFVRITSGFHTLDNGTLIKSSPPYELAFHLKKSSVQETNSVNRKDIFEETGENVIIYNDGTALWHSIKHLKTFVHVDTTNYPFEVQVFRFNFSKLYFDDTYQQNY